MFRPANVLTFDVIHGTMRISEKVGDMTMSENLLERIEVNPQIMMGKPVIKGTRIPVEMILKKLAHRISVEEILRDYPRLTEDDIKAAALYAAEVLESTVTYDLIET